MSYLMCLLYAYTNDKSTVIRHALMDSSVTYTPSSAEALFMQVSLYIA